MPWTKTPQQRQQDARRYGTTWRKARAAALKRASWRCEIRIEGVCIGAASQVDHIQQAGNDPRHQNLRAACKPCHAKITAQQGGGYRRQPPSPDPQPRPATSW